MYIVPVVYSGFELISRVMDLFPSVDITPLSINFTVSKSAMGVLQ